MIPDFPTTRSEAYLAKICGGDAELPEPQTRTDLFLAAIAGADVTTPEPQTRSEIFLASILGQSVELPAPQSRLEIFLAKIAGLDVETPEPQTRLELYLDEWAQGGGAEYETVTGAIATFTTLRAAPLQSLIVNIDPVQSGSGDPSPDNVRPISGWTHAEIFRTGKNIYDDSYFELDGKYAELHGIHTPSTADATKKLYGVYLKGGQTYRIYIDFGATKQFGVYAARTGLSTQIQVASNASRSKYNATYTPTYDGWYCFWLYASSGWSSLTKADFTVQIYADDEAYSQAYPYVGTSLTVDLGGTVYAGTLDVLTGTLTARPYYASYNGETLVGPWVSSMDKYVAGATPTTGAQVVDLGGTPTTYQLTPEEVTALLGENNVWADTGNVTVTYQSN